MEEAYRTVGLAISRLVSEAGEEIEHVKNQAVLRSVLQLRPVILGYALSTLARRLRESSALGQQHAQVPAKSAGASTADAKADSAAVRLPPHTGIRLALEVVLGSSYDPSGPHALAPVVDALGEDNLEALLLAPGEEGPSLPWNARLCLLHACLCGGRAAAGRRKWSWLPTVADSASSFALQEIATEGSSTSTSTSNTGNANGNGKGRAQTSTAGGAPPHRAGKLAGADRAVSFSAAVMARVCEDLATVGAAGAGSTPGGSGFPSIYAAGPTPGVPDKTLPSACPAGVFAEQKHVMDSFRLKLQALRGALTSRMEMEGRAADQSATTGGTETEYVGVGDFDVHPGVVRRALERSHCGEAFILAVQAALEVNVLTNVETPKGVGRNLSSHSDGRMTLKRVLEACLFGAGLPAGQGLLDVVATDVSDLGFIGSSSSTTAIARMAAGRGTHPSQPTPKPPETQQSQACALIQGLVEEGTRIRDLCLTLLGMHNERDRRRRRRRRQPPRARISDAASVQPDSSCWWTAAEVVATIDSACEFRRKIVAEVARSFVEWVADTPWVWGATEGVEGEDWEGDFAAAAETISTLYPSHLAGGGGGGGGGGEGMYVERPPAGRGLKSVRGACPYEQRTSSGGTKTGGVLLGSGLADPVDVLDRLVASAAMAMGLADADNVEWITVLQRVTTAATATDALRAYAVVCVEKSAALGGQAPLRVAGKRRFSQVGGGQLWGLLERACMLHGDCLMTSEREPAAVLVRVAATAVTAARKISQSWMISPGLLGSGPVQAAIDMLGASKQRVTASDLLAGLMQRPGADGPTLAADLFAALIAAAAAAAAAAATVESGRDERGDHGLSGLRARAIAWLTGALSACYVPAHPPGNSCFGIDGAILSTALARNLIRRVPFEAKPVLLAVEEAARLASAAGGRDERAGTRRSAKRKQHVAPGGEGSDGGAVVASLLKMARAAMKSPLLPLAVPVSPSESGLEEGQGGEASGAGAIPVPDEGPNQSPAGSGKEPDAPSASVTAGLMLDAFVQSPVAVRRSIRQKMRQRDCDSELLAVQRSLRRALCTAPAPLGEDGGFVAAADADDTDSGRTATTLLAGLGTRKAPACLLVGYLVEKRVPGWEDTKAAMTPPPPQLLEAAGGAVLGAGCDCSRQPLTALRLDMWLRSFLCSAENSRFDAGFDIEKSFPDVFRTARTLARAIAQRASALVTNGNNQGEQGPGSNGYQTPYPGSRGYDVAELLRPDFVNGNSNGDGGGNSRQGVGAAERLEPPRQALAGRLQSTPATGELISWVTSVVKTAKQYRQWLPWQPFADELRELVLLSVRQRSVQEAAACGGDGEGAGGRALTAKAAVFAVCELLCAWEETPEEVIAAVFRPALCSRALNTAVAPVTRDARPPIWLEVLRRLIGEEGCDISGWMYPEDLEGGAPQHPPPLAVAAAAAVWIGGDGPGAGQSGDRSSREAWVRWYGDNLGSLMPTADGEQGSWLIISSNSTAESRVKGVVQVQMGTGGAAHTIQPEEWQRWGRSPLQAAWNFAGGWGVEEEAGGEGSPITGVDGAPPAIVLPPFASWLRAVLRSGPNCPEGLLEAYLRRMAREVYLPCQFGGASGEMARQWLGALIEAEAGAEGRAKKNASSMTVGASSAVSSGGAVVKTDFSPTSGGGTAQTNASAMAVSAGNAVSKGGVVVKTEFPPVSVGGTAAPARELVVKSFFREELLRFGSGQAAAAAPVGGPLTWLWPLEAVVAACGKAGSFGSGRLARRRRRRGGGNLGPEGPPPVDPTGCIVLNGPPSALARALCTVPHDLLCGSRRFDRGGGQPPPATATLRAFATRAVDLTARALATPPCRHWSVARRLLLGLGLLYHALAEPGLAVRDSSSAARAGAVGVAEEEAAAAQARAQAAALSAIESLVSIALGLNDHVAGAGGVQSGGTSARCVEGGQNRGAGVAGMPGSTPFLTSACRALRPLETGSCAGADDFAEALRGAGAWRAAAAFFGRRKKATRAQAVQAATSLVQDPPAVVAQTLPLVSAAQMASPRSPQVGPRQHPNLPSPGAMPVIDVDQAVGGPAGGHEANGLSTADSCVSQLSGAGGHEVDVDSPQAPPFEFPMASKQAAPRRNKQARLSSNPVDGRESRLPYTGGIARASKRLRRGNDA